MSFQDWLVAEQRRRRLTSDELARMSGVSVRLLQKYRSGGVKWPRGQNRERLERVLGPAPPEPDPFDEPDPVAA